MQTKLTVHANEFFLNSHRTYCTETETSHIWGITLILFLNTILAFDAYSNRIKALQNKYKHNIL